MDTHTQQTEPKLKATLFSQYDSRGDGEDISHLSEQQRANLWIVKGNVGVSSKCIWGHMTGTVTSGCASSYPHDGGDFNRCLLLLEAVPEWKPRMAEMAAHGDVWAKLASNWESITAAFIEEAGLNYSKSNQASQAYALIKAARGL